MARRIAVVLCKFSSILFATSMDIEVHLTMFIMVVFARRCMGSDELTLLTGLDFYDIYWYVRCRLQTLIKAVEPRQTGLDIKSYYR